MPTGPRPRDAVCAYLKAKEAVIASGYSDEIEWQKNVSFDNMTETNFLTEFAWVVINSGMRWTVAKQKFPAFAKAFMEFGSASEIIAHVDSCREKALKAFGHKGKVEAVIGFARCIQEQGFSEVKAAVARDGVIFLRRFAFMGPATSQHLAKNLGLNAVKPDRHLVRIATALGYASALELCKDIALAVGDKLSVVDMVLWRYAALNKGYLVLFQREVAVHPKVHNDDYLVFENWGDTHNVDPAGICDEFMLGTAQPGL